MFNMPQTTSSLELIKRIRKMPDIEKLKLVDSILRELDMPNPEVDKAWSDEAVKRWKAYREGNASSVSYADAMKKYRSR